MIEESPKCQNCGQAFEPTCHVTRQKFCCDTCRVQYHNAKRYFNGVPHVCPQCGETVEHGGEKGPQRRFCNEKCSRAYYENKRREARRIAAETRLQRICPHCGREFRADYKGGQQQRFCCDVCRIGWWDAYNKANPAEKLLHCTHCGREFKRGKRSGIKYCSRNCYLQALAGTHDERRCQWCGEAFACYANESRKYCGKSCAAAARSAKARAAKGSSLITTRQPKAWRQQLARLAQNSRFSATGGRIFLICGAHSVGSQDVLVNVIRYEFKRDPFSGDRYVFCDANRLKWLEWDGAAFCVGSRRAECGTYPWPSAKAGALIEITEREFAFLRSRSIGEKFEKNP
jgi:endogenous inhibitor of DNA gyrase (YacG/DUF329 family)